MSKGEARNLGRCLISLHSSHGLQLQRLHRQRISHVCSRSTHSYRRVPVTATTFSPTLESHDSGGSSSCSYTFVVIIILQRRLRSTLTALNISLQCKSHWVKMKKPFLRTSLQNQSLSFSFFSKDKRGARAESKGGGLDKTVLKKRIRPATIT